MNERGAIYERVTDDGTIISVVPMIFNWRLTAGNEYTYGKGYCFDDLDKCLAAAKAWDGESDPLDGWVRELHPPYRRRPGGYREEEYRAP